MSMKGEAIPGSEPCDGKADTNEDMDEVDEEDYPEDEEYPEDYFTYGGTRPHDSGGAEAVHSDTHHQSSRKGLPFPCSHHNRWAKAVGSPSQRGGHHRYESARATKFHL